MYLSTAWFCSKNENKRGTFVSPLEPLRRQSSAEQLDHECLKARRWLPCLPVLWGRCSPISNPSSAFHGDCGSQQHGSCHAIVFPITKQNLPNKAVAIPQLLSLSLSLSFFLSFYLSLSLTALQQCSEYPDSNRTHFWRFWHGEVKWTELH